MRKPRGELTRRRILLAVVGLGCLVMLLEAPALFFKPDGLVHHKLQQPMEATLDSQVPRRTLEEPPPPPPPPAFKETREVVPASQQAVGARASTNASTGLQEQAAQAWEAGTAMWEAVEARWTSNSTRIRSSARNQQQQQCPQVIVLSGDELRATNSVMLLPCGLVAGSSISLAGRPLKAHPVLMPHIAMTHDGREEPVMVSQFAVELRGLKMAAGEDPPRILHLNPRIRGDWSGKPVIEQNTCYRGQWGVAQRCEGWLSSEDEDSVDGLPKCESWLREDRSSNSSSRKLVEDRTKSSWLNRWMTKPDKGLQEWAYPLVEERLFVLTIRAGWEGYHVSVDGRHITSFPYRTGYILEEATGLAVAGDIDLHSVVATSLPSSPTSLSSEQLLEENEKFKAPALPTGPVHLFIGILSASTHFAERMAVRKSWLQSSSILSSAAVARFFVGMHPDVEINLQVREEAEYFGDMVILPFMDHYDLVVLKTIAICEYAVRNVSARHIMKVDDDTFVRVETVSGLLKSSKKAPGLYMGNINQFHRPLREGKWAVTYEEWPEEEYPPYANGPGYIISADIAKFILEQKQNNTLRLFKMEDVSMGMWVGQFNLGQAVHYVHNLRFCQWGCVEEYYTAHYQSPRQMLCMWAKLQQGEAQCCNM